MRNAVVIAAILAVITSPVQAKQEVLRLLTWEGHAPAAVIKLFTRKTGIKVLVTKSNNVDMIARLRANGGADFDLAQPTQDQITGAQAEFNIYKPIDLSKINTKLFIPTLLAMTKQYTTVNDKVYGVPQIWGTSGLVVDRKKASMVRDYTDLCRREVKGRVSYRLQKPTLMAFAFALGFDPFAAYADKALYQTILDTVAKKLLLCHSNINSYWSSGEALLNQLRSGEVLAAMAWDTGGWKLNRKNSKLTFIAPKSGALGWVATFAIPRKSRLNAAAYQWINFVMQAKIAAMITATTGNFSAASGADAYIDPVQKKRFRKSFPKNAMEQIHWYPPMPIGLGAMEDRTLRDIKTAIARQSNNKK